MEALLTLVSILGIGALVISVYIFAMSARRFVSESDHERTAQVTWVTRRGEDRRQNTRPVQFPIIVNGELITEDRRRGGDRRANGAA